jgi:hypothetical protein
MKSSSVKCFCTACKWLSSRCMQCSDANAIRCDSRSACCRWATTSEDPACPRSCEVGLALPVTCQGVLIVISILIHWNTHPLALFVHCILVCISTAYSYTCASTPPVLVRRVLQQHLCTITVACSFVSVAMSLMKSVGMQAARSRLALLPSKEKPDLPHPHNVRCAFHNQPSQHQCPQRVHCPDID